MPAAPRRPSLPREMPTEVVGHDRQSERDQTGRLPRGRNTVGANSPDHTHESPAAWRQPKFRAQAAGWRPGAGRSIEEFQVARPCQGEDGVGPVVKVDHDDVAWLGRLAEVSEQGPADSLGRLVRQGSYGRIEAERRVLWQRFGARRRHARMIDRLRPRRLELLGDRRELAIERFQRVVDRRGRAVGQCDPAGVPRGAVDVIGDALAP